MGSRSVCRPILHLKSSYMLTLKMSFKFCILQSRMTGFRLKSTLSTKITLNLEDFKMDYSKAKVFFNKENQYAGNL